MNEILEKIVPPSVVVFLAWIGSFEWRLRNKIGRKEFDLFVSQSMTQGTRLESHIWDIMKAQNITPSIEVPEEIKNNNK